MRERSGTVRYLRLYSGRVPCLFVAPEREDHEDDGANTAFLDGRNVVAMKHPGSRLRTAARRVGSCPRPSDRPRSQDGREGRERGHHHRALPPQRGAGPWRRVLLWACAAGLPCPRVPLLGGGTFLTCQLVTVWAEAQTVCGAVQANT